MFVFNSRIFKTVGVNNIIKRNMSNHPFTNNELKLIVGLGAVCGVSNFIALFFAVKTSTIICHKNNT